MALSCAAPAAVVAASAVAADALPWWAAMPEAVAPVTLKVQVSDVPAS